MTRKRDNKIISNERRQFNKCFRWRQKTIIETNLTITPKLNKELVNPIISVKKAYYLSIGLVNQRLNLNVFLANY